VVSIRYDRGRAAAPRRQSHWSWWVYALAGPSLRFTDGVDTGPDSPVPHDKRYCHDGRRELFTTVAELSQVAGWTWYECA
jgi:hypothetical protein